MNTTHTPGPWEILKQNHNLHIGHKTTHEYIGDRWQFVVRPFPEQRSGAKRGCSPSWYGWSPLIEANARLIAASPDLLSACQKLIIAFGEITHNQFQEAPVILFARSAIAKATGGAQ